jgi:hypothetical protein
VRELVSKATGGGACLLDPLFTWRRGDGRGGAHPRSVRSCTDTPRIAFTVSPAKAPMAKYTAYQRMMVCPDVPPTRAKTQTTTLRQELLKLARSKGRDGGRAVAEGHGGCFPLSLWGERGTHHEAGPLAPRHVPRVPDFLRPRAPLALEANRT